MNYLIFNLVVPVLIATYAVNTVPPSIWVAVLVIAPLSFLSVLMGEYADEQRV